MTILTSIESPGRKDGTSFSALAARPLACSAWRSSARVEEALWWLREGGREMEGVREGGKRLG